MDNLLLPDDDMPIHQAALPLARLASFHPRWTERWYFNVQNEKGMLLAIFGGGYYPSTGVLETYACLLLDGIQTNIRSQKQTTNRLELHTGSGAFFEVLERMVSWSFGVAGVDAGAKLDFRATSGPHLFAPFSSPALASDRPDDLDEIQHFVQPGSITGHL